MGGEEGSGLLSRVFNTFQHRLMQWQKISPCYQQNVSTIYFFPKLNTTVKVHRAQRIHICSTRYTLYKLDMYNSTECLNPRGSPATQSVSMDEAVRASEEPVGRRSFPHGRGAPVRCAVRTGTATAKIKARVDYDYPAN